MVKNISYKKKNFFGKDGRVLKQKFKTGHYELFLWNLGKYNFDHFTNIQQNGKFKYILKDIFCLYYCFRQINKLCKSVNVVEYVIRTKHTFRNFWN